VALSPGLKPPGREVDHSLPHSDIESVELRSHSPTVFIIWYVTTTEQLRLFHLKLWFSLTTGEELTPVVGDIDEPPVCTSVFVSP
jgi:hypothetical protein